MKRLSPRFETIRSEHRNHTSRQSCCQRTGYFFDPIDVVESNRFGNLSDRSIIFPMPKYTMRDVARLAGASVATVSAVINGTATVSEHLTQKILDSMKALDYH